MQNEDWKGNADAVRDSSHLKHFNMTNNESNNNKGKNYNTNTI